jgi:proline iminopeptidase
MRTLYPEIEPYRSGRLQVSQLHNLYYEECGNPQGSPAVFLHGGPGGATSPTSRRFFDPEFYRSILFDQRGAGKSTPYAEIAENNTWKLVEDMESLRIHLGIERWLVFGGSWGSTLALCYAIAHPERVVGLVLRGVYLGRKWENKWLFQEGASYIYPDNYDKYIAPIPPQERGDLIGAYYHLLTDPDEAVHLPASQTWSAWEGGLVHLNPEPRPENGNPRDRLAIARFECHYIVNEMFFPSDNYILENIHLITHLPCRIVHGRFDVCVPPRNAWELSKAYPKAVLSLVQDGSHAATDPGMASELVQALDDFRGLFKE